jgi:4-alpha-glucanotransferase
MRQHGGVEDSPLVTSYTDALGTERHSPDWAVREVEERVRSTGGDARYAEVVRVSVGEPAHAVAGRTLVLESGEEVPVGDTIPEDLPYGYHEVDGPAGRSLVLHAPPRVPAPPRGWVLAAQLYAARSHESWGHGDLRDARTLAGWVAESGPGGLLMLNPLHAALPGTHPQPSPYFASTRAYRNPIYLTVDELDVRPDGPAARSREHGRALNATEQIDRTAVWTAKRAALASLWPRAAADPRMAERVDRWLDDPVNGRYARFCSAGDHEGVGADPRFHAWLQICTEDQLLAVGPNVVHDVAVGVDRAGADAHLWPDAFVADGTRIGCPPDQFNTLGQDWGLPPFHPGGLRASGYEPFVRAIRAAVRGAAGIRIDHVMGLERTFWIPEAGDPRDGVYVRYQLDEMLDVVAIEAHRAGAFVVGEDLGTVPPSIPVALAERGMLSYRIMALDHTHPNDYPTSTMAAVTTHDLPTVLGLLSGSDLADQESLGMAPNVADTWAAVDRLRWWVGAGEAPPEALVGRIHDLIAGSSAQLAVATLDDLAGARRRPNMPGTIDEWPNWRIPLPRPLGDVLTDPNALAIRGALAARAGGRGS